MSEALERFSPQSKSSITTLLRGNRLGEGKESIGPLDQNAKLILRLVIQNFVPLSNSAGQERANSFMSSYRALKSESLARTADTNPSLKVQPAAPSEGAEGKAQAHPLKPNWRLQELRATSFRGLAPPNEEVIVPFYGQSTLLFGPNGAGKSSLLGAIAWLFTNVAPTDADEAEDRADFFSGPSTSSPAKKVGQWPIHNTLPSGNLKNAVVVTSVTIRLRSADGASEKWLWRSDLDTLQESDDGATWKPCNELSNLGIEPLDLQLSLLAPMIFGRKTVEKADETRQLLQLMLGYDDLVSVGTLAGQIGINRTALETAETKSLRERKEKIAASLAALPVELDENSPVKPELQILASDNSVTLEKLNDVAHSVCVETVERERDLAKALGLATSQQEVPKGIGEKLIGAVTVLQLEANKAFSRLSQIELGGALPQSSEKSSETRLEELRNAIANFCESVKGPIEQRYEWWKREYEPHSRAPLLLLASRYYNHDKQLCPVCDRSIASLPVMQQLVELKELPQELQRAIADFFRDLGDKFDAILPSSISGLGDTAISKRIEDDWKALKARLDPVFLPLCALQDAQVAELAASAILEAPSPVELLPSDCDVAFKEAARTFIEKLQKARYIISVLTWSNTNYAFLLSSLDKVTLAEGEESNSLLAVLAKGKAGAQNLAALTRIAISLKDIYLQEQAIEIQEVQLALIKEVKEPLATLKSLVGYAEHEVSKVFANIAGKTVDYWKKLYPETPSVLGAGGLAQIRNGVEPRLAGKDYSVPAKYFANSGLQRAIALSFYFALLDSHPYGLGFIVMDDSILSLDNEHRETWSADILKPRMGLMQVIFATHQKEFVHNCSQDFATGRIIELNPRTTERALSCRPGDRLQRATEDLSNAEWNVENTLRKYVEEVVSSLDAYSSTPFFNPRDLTNSIGSYAAIKSPNVLASESQKKIVKILQGSDVQRVINAGSHAQSEGLITKPMIRLCLDQLIACDKPFRAELERFERIRRPSRQARQLPLSNVVVFPQIPNSAIWETPIKIRSIGRAAARPDGISISESEESAIGELPPGSLVLVCGDSLAPVARAGQWVILDDEDEGVLDADLVAIEAFDGRRLLRRVWHDEDFWRLQAINPISTFPIESIPKSNASARRICGVIYEPTKPHLMQAGQEWKPDDYAGPLASDRWKSIVVEGSSLDPVARNGQVVLVSAGEDPNSAQIRPGSLVAAETMNESVGNVIKRLFRTADGYVLVSANPVEPFEPITLSKREIKRVWPLIGVLFDAARLTS